MSSLPAPLPWPAREEAGDAAPGRGRIVRARVAGYDAATRRATVQPLHGPRALLADVPALTSCPPRHLSVGNEVALLLWPDVGALILGAWAPAPAQVPHAWVSDVTARTFNTAAWVNHPGLSATLTLPEAAHLWISVQVNARHSAARTVAFSLVVTVDGVILSPGLNAGCALANSWVPACFTMRTASPCAAGAHTLRLQAYVYTSGDTLTLQYCSLGAVALPEE